MSGLVEMGEIYLWFSLWCEWEIGEGGGRDGFGSVSGVGLKFF
jgi:hypothetical protein